MAVLENDNSDRMKSGMTFTIGIVKIRLIVMSSLLSTSSLGVKPVTDERVFYDKFLCDKFYLLVCTRNFDNFFYIYLYTLTAVIKWLGAYTLGQTWERQYPKNCE